MCVIGGRENAASTSYPPPEFKDAASTSPLNERYLKKLMQLAEQSVRRVAFVSMPIHNGVLQPDEHYFERINAIHESVGFSRCTTSLESWDRKFFNDNSHLNAAGVTRFDREVLDRLNFCEFTR